MFAAISRLIEQRAIDRDRFEVPLVGNVWIGGRPVAQRTASRCDVSATSTTVGLCKEMRRATALLFYQPLEYPGPSGKIFEYLLSGRPILCVAGRENLAYRLVDELGAGAVATRTIPGRSIVAFCSCTTMAGRRPTGSIQACGSAPWHVSPVAFLTEELAGVLEDAVRLERWHSWCSEPAR